MQAFENHDDVRKEYLELIKTPQELRKEAGVDEYLTTQRRKDFKTNQRAKHKKFRDTLRPARKNHGLANTDES